MPKNNIKKIRKMKRMTMEEVARILGITRMSMYNLENREDIPKKYIEKLTTIFNCTLEELQCENNEDNNQTNQQEKQILQIKKFASVNDIDNNKSTTKILTLDLLHLLTNNKQINDYSNLAICTSDDKTIIVDLSTKNITSNKQLFIIKIKNSNEIKIATIMKDMWTEKIALQIDNMDVKLFENQQQFDNDCELLGRVVSRIVDC